MSPEQAKVILVEGDPYFAARATRSLRDAGHEVVKEVTTPAEVEAMLSQIPKLAEQYGKERIVVVLGESLGGEVRRGSDPHSEIQILLRSLHDQEWGDIRTVGYVWTNVPGVTVNVWRGFGPEQLAGAVTRL